MRRNHRYLSINENNVNNEYVNYIIDNVPNDNLRNELLAEYFRTHRFVEQLSRTSAIQSGINRALSSLDEILNTSLEQAQSNLRHPTLSNQQFNSIPIKRYDTIRTEIGSDIISCPICQNEFNDTEQLKILRCKHYFHPICIRNWLVNHNIQCPICRANVLLQIQESNQQTPEITQTTFSDTSSNSDVLNVDREEQTNILSDITNVPNNNVSTNNTQMTPGMHLGNNIGQLLLSTMRYVTSRQQNTQ